ncbi:MAG: hypothetical protein LBS09_09495 [Bacteroidales bacterium]|jgi:bifunctional ADP-heptose synthase (sugar kinase/adenylyltransferase)|nr:hypothetical protein [Bacteroidales bacterium]
METDFVQLIHSKMEPGLLPVLQQTARWRHREWKTVFVCGNFEEIDSRSLNRLTEAANLGGRLIVAVRTDNLTRKIYRRKPDRKQEDRALPLASMTFVSIVVYLNEEHPAELIRQLHPDVTVDFPEEIRMHPVAHIRRRINEHLKIRNIRSTNIT